MIKIITLTTGRIIKTVAGISYLEHGIEFNDNDARVFIPYANILQIRTKEGGKNATRTV